MSDYQEYRKWVTCTAECAIDSLRDYPDRDAHDALWETCDGQVVYYSDGATVMEHTDNPEAIEDVGDLSGESWVGIRQRFACWAFQADVADVFWPMLEELRDAVREEYEDAHADWSLALFTYEEACKRFDLYVAAGIGTEADCAAMWPVRVTLSDGVARIQQDGTCNRAGGDSFDVELDEPDEPCAVWLD